MDAIYNLSFGTAINILKEGHKVARAGWDGKGMYLFLATDIEFNTIADLSEFVNQDVEVCESIVMKTADNKFVVGWLASQTDMLTRDWGVVD